MKWSVRILTAFLVAVLIVPAVTTAWAQISGRYRIYLMDKESKYVEGDVTELKDGSFEVKTKQGAVVTVKKNQVRRIVPLDELLTTPGQTSPGAEAPKRTPLRREITAAEIDEILAGIKAEPTGDPTVTRKDLMAPLPVDEDSVKEMLSQAGLTRDNKPLEQQKNVLLKDHFVMVYTSTDKAARELASRLEAVWRWKVRFMEMLKIPARRPEYKLELFYFGTQKEFEAHAINYGGSPDAAGYYTPSVNRSHFFDLITHPVLAHVLEQLKKPGIEYHIRQYYTNIITRWTEFMNVSVIQHEAGHHMDFNMGLFPRNGLERESSVPIWLVEGTTQMFEFPPTAAGASLGVVNHYRLDELRKHYPSHPLDAGQWKLFIIDNGQWRGGPSYPLGWAMVYYLYTKKRPLYAKYLQTVFGRDENTRMTNTEREKEFEDLFGRVDDKWVEEFNKFLDGLQVKKSVLPPDLFGP